MAQLSTSNGGCSLTNPSGTDIYIGNSSNTQANFRGSGWYLGQGTNIAVNRLEVGGGCCIGTGYVGTVAPTNGMIVQGNMGVGQISPSYQLDVSGQSKFLGSIAVKNTPNLDYPILSCPTGFVKIPALSGSTFGMTGSAALGMFGGSDAYMIGFDSVNTTKGYIRHNIADGSAGSNTWGHVFSYGTATSPTNVLFVGGGNVGIGTVTPNSQLQFPNSVLRRTITLYESTNNDHQFCGFGIQSFTLVYQVVNSSANHIFYAGASSSSSTELMRIQGNGAVGIGVSSGFLDTLNIGDGTSAGYAGIGLFNSGVKWTIRNVNSDNSLRFGDTGAYRVYFLQGGAVGVGISPPSSSVGLYLPTSGGTSTCLNYYEEYTHTSNWTGSFTTFSTSIYLTRVGRIVTIFVPNIYNSGNSTTAVSNMSSVIPVARFLPSSTVGTCVENFDTTGGSGLTTYSGWAKLGTDGSIKIYKDGASSGFSSVGAGITIGTYSFSFSFSV